MRLQRVQIISTLRQKKPRNPEQGCLSGDDINMRILNLQSHDIINGYFSYMCRYLLFVYA